MADHLIRFYQRKDVNEIKSNLLIYGDLGGVCANCNDMDVKIDQDQCPTCKTQFDYISFRNIKAHIPKVYKLIEERPQVTIVDYDDYHRNDGASKAEKFFG